MQSSHAYMREEKGVLDEKKQEPYLRKLIRKESQIG